LIKFANAPKEGLSPSLANDQFLGFLAGSFSSFVFICFLVVQIFARQENLTNLHRHFRFLYRDTGKARQ
jgi:hypothetical protein